MADTLNEMVEVVKGFVGDSGVCSYERAAKAVNQARRLLYNKRSWISTCEYVCIACVDSCFTLPSRYEQIQLAWVNGNPASLADEWFNSTPIAKFYKDNSCHRQITEVGGKHVLFRDYSTRPYQIAVLAESIEDVGVEIGFEAYDEYGTYRQVNVTAPQSPEKGLSETTAVGIRAISKPKTKGRVRVYAHDPVLETDTLIGIYQPLDINPWFRRFYAPKGCNCITLYASKKFYDLEDGMEIVEFTADAMIYAVLALNSRENRKPQEFLTNLSLAVQEEEKSMSDEEIPTASPIKFVDYRRPEGLIDRQSLFGAQDYYQWP
jgi:hypothetical protein